MHGQDNTSYIDQPADKENGKDNWILGTVFPSEKGDNAEIYYRPGSVRSIRGNGGKDIMNGSAERRGMKSVSKEKSWRDVCYNFTQKTSIHGINKVTEETPFATRRVIWLVLLLLGLAGCIYQVGERTQYLLSNPVSVNVKVIYNKTLRFPAITICNQNVFRLSEAYRLGYYEVLDSMFNPKEEFNPEKYNASSLVLYDLYHQLRHRREQFIVRCTWNNMECEEGTLMTVMTDHGSCLTFNGNRSSEVLAVSQTGADRGLRLQLNVEQYEYMSGPHDAAGLKILLHNQNEVPLVRDLGEAIPTGVTAFVGVQTQAVTNLRPPHGSCDDSKNLSFYNYYSSSACKSDCRAIYAKKNCGCKDIYMPESGVSYCNLVQHVNCIIPEIDISTVAEDQCACPVPCHNENHKTTVTFSSSSGISTAQLVISNLTQNLSQRYMEAREIRQRVDPYIVNTDTVAINDLHQKWTRLDTLLKYMTNQTRHTRLYLDQLVVEISDRIYWHRVWGIEKIKLAVDRNFARGWEVMDERTFIHLTTKFYQQSSLYKRMVEESLAHANDSNLRLVHYLTTDRELQYRAELADRALSNYTTLHEAFVNKTPIYNFRLTPMRNVYNYDRQYSKNLEFFQAETADKYYKKILQYSLDYLKHIESLREDAKTLYENGTIDEEGYLWSLSRFEQRCRNFNYYRYMYRENVVLQAQSIAQDRVYTFIALNHTLHGHIDELRLTIFNTETLLEEFEEHFVRSITGVVNEAKDYLVNTTLFKSTLAKAMTSKQMIETLSDASAFLKDMRTRGQQMADAWQRFRVSFERVWLTIISETSLRYVHENTRDILQQALQPNETEYRNTFFEYIAPMLNIDMAEILTYSEEELMRKMNADTPDLTKDKLTEIVTDKFDRVTRSREILTRVTLAADTFTTAMEKTQEDMRAYLQSTTIDNNFYKDNFLQLNVYMSEMNYEEIEQQVAYDEFGLISDIGGAMGLFIGASFLSLFEFFDIIISTFLQKYICNFSQHEKNSKEEEK